MDIESATVVIDGKQWQSGLPELDDLEVLVAPWENAAFDRELQKAIRALPPAQRADGVVQPAAYYRVLGKVMVKTILFGWKNFKVGGADTPFDAATAEPYLTDPKFRPFRDGVVAASKRVQQNIKADEDAVLGNLPMSLPGSDNGQATKTA